jgi:hypothetical protein
MNSRRRLALLTTLVGAALAIFGALWTTCALVSALGFPVAGYGAWNLSAGLALVIVGALMVLRGIWLRRRSQ